MGTKSENFFKQIIIDDSADATAVIAEFLPLIFRKPTEEDKVRNQTLRDAAKKFSESGWIIPYYTSLEISRQSILQLSKETPEQIDDFMYRQFKKQCSREFRLLIRSLKKLTFENPQYLSCALALYKKRQYLGCCTMILALIEQKMRSVIGRRVRTVAKQSDMFIKNTFEAFPLDGWERHPIGDFVEDALRELLSTYFASANDFSNEPSVINRNFLMHGMAIREYTDRDCIKLFLLLNFIGRAAQRSVENA